MWIWPQVSLLSLGIFTLPVEYIESVCQVTVYTFSDSEESNKTMKGFHSVDPKIVSLIEFNGCQVYPLLFHHPG